MQLALYESNLLEKITLSGDSYDLVLGLDENLVQQLKQYSLNRSDEALLQYTSDYQRFGEGSYADWYKKGRLPYALVNTESNELATFAWLGPKPFGVKSMKHQDTATQKTIDSENTDVWHTTGYRAYGAYRGNGLMTPFLRLVFVHYLSNNKNAQIWAIIDTTNPASLRLAEKIGFTEHSKESRTHAIMVYR